MGNRESIVRTNRLGRWAKRSQRTWDPGEDEWGDWETVYFINSSVTARIASEATGTGKYKYSDALSGGMTSRTSHSSGTVFTYGSNYDGAPTEADPMGGNMGTETLYVEEPPEPPLPSEDFPAFSITEADPSMSTASRKPDSESSSSPASSNVYPVKGFRN